MEEFTKLEDINIVEDFTKIQDTKLMTNALRILYTISDIRLAMANTDKISISMVEYLNMKLLHCRDELNEARTMLKKEQKTLE